MLKAFTLNIIGLYNREKNKERFKPHLQNVNIKKLIQILQNFD